METVLDKMAIASNSLLLALGRVLGGIQINDEPPLVLLFSRASVARVRTPSKATKPMALPGTSFSNQESMDWLAPG